MRVGPGPGPCDALDDMGEEQDQGRSICRGTMGAGHTVGKSRDDTEGLGRGAAREAEEVDGRAWEEERRGPSSFACSLPSTTFSLSSLFSPINLHTHTLSLCTSIP